MRMKVTQGLLNKGIGSCQKRTTRKILQRLFRRLEKVELYVIQRTGREQYVE